MSMRGVYTNVVKIRQMIFSEVAKMAYEGGDFKRIAELPYEIIPGEAVLTGRVYFWSGPLWRSVSRLAIGLPVRDMSERTPGRGGNRGERRGKTVL